MNSLALLMLSAMLDAQAPPKPAADLPSPPAALDDLPPPIGIKPEPAKEKAPPKKAEPPKKVDPPKVDLLDEPPMPAPAAKKEKPKPVPTSAPPPDALPLDEPPAPTKAKSEPKPVEAAKPPALKPAEEKPAAPPPTAIPQAKPAEKSPPSLTSVAEPKAPNASESRDAAGRPRLGRRRGKNDPWENGAWPTGAASLPPAKVVLSNPKPLLYDPDLRVESAPPPPMRRPAATPPAEVPTITVESVKEPTVIPAPKSAPPADDGVALARSRLDRRRISSPLAISDDEPVRKDVLPVQAVVAEKPDARGEVERTSANVPTPEPPAEQYELIQPKTMKYDVVAANGAALPRESEIEQVQYVQNESGRRVARSATKDETPVESYAVKLWLVDGWETWRELSRIEYGTDSLGEALAKYNRSLHKPTQTLAPGVRVRLPPRSVLQKSGPRVSSNKPTLLKGDFQAPPATTVKGSIPDENNIVAESKRDRTASSKSPTVASRMNATPKRIEPDGEPLPSADPNAASAPTPPKGPEFVVDKEGMTLYGIAAITLGDGKKKDVLYKLNRDRIGSADGELRVGAKLRLPPDAKMVR